ncbi:alcohol dehydrogenase catalytic domain-containing protein [Arthrobacter tecti]
MLSANYVGGRTVEVREVAPLPPAPGQVQIKVAYVGICGTDLHILHGHMDARVTMPAILGHEMSGVISQVGDDVDGWKVGDPVTVMPLEWDGSCPACLAGNQHICQNLNFIGIDSPGALQGYWNVSSKVLVALPPALRLDHAALVEPLAVAVHDVRRAELQPGETAVVIGGGPIGVLIASTAREFGAEVVVIEPDPSRRQAVAELGFQVLDPQTVDQAAWVEEWTSGAGADVVFEVSGAAQAVLAAPDLAKVRGRVVVVAIHPDPRPVNLQRVFWREMTIIGARVYERSDYEAAVKLLDRGVIPVDLLISRIAPISETSAAFDALSSGGAMKILIDCQAGA